MKEKFLTYRGACIQQAIEKKQFFQFQKVCQISIDGHKRDRYMLKIDDMTNTIRKAQLELNDEERKIERGHVNDS
jgi:hypothetical protein